MVRVAAIIPLAVGTTTIAVLTLTIGLVVLGPTSYTVPEHY